MRTIRITLLTFLLLATVFFSYSQATKPDLLEKLKELPNVANVQKIKGDTTFSEYYEMWFIQPIDHNTPDAGSFQQKVLLGHHGIQHPMVVELQGYNIWTEKAGELSKLLHANQLSIEHRYFDKSRPDSLIWDKLTIQQAAADQHAIIQALKKIYSKKWISTGISKGGQTTIYHRYFYPDDVDLSIPYVAPMNLAREDKRIHKHLANVGSEQCRKKIHDFQVACFQKRTELLPLLKQHANKKNYQFSMGIEKALDLNILEYSFAFWQWGNTSCHDIPKPDATINELFEHLIQTSSFSFFDNTNIHRQQAFYYQALTQIGMYSYKIEDFKEYLPYKTDLTFDFTMPKGVKATFNPVLMQNVNKWLQTEAKNMIFIYGEYDTWSATAVELKKNKDCKKFINPKGSHGTRIKDFPLEMKKEILSYIERYAGIKIDQQKQL